MSPAGAFDHEEDNYACRWQPPPPIQPKLKALRPLAPADGYIRYCARHKYCAARDIKQGCTPDMVARKVMRSVSEGAGDLPRLIATSDAYTVTRHQRRRVEWLFAHLKRVMRMEPLRLRGPNGAKDKFHP